MIGKQVILGLMIGVSATVAVVGLGVGYFGLGKPRGGERSPAPAEVHAPAPSKAATITLSGQFKKDLAKHPVFVLGDRPIPFEADEEEQKSFLAGGTVEIVSLDGDVVASGDIAENGTFTLKIPPAPKYIVRAKNDVVSVSYAVITGGLPDMKQIPAARTDAPKSGGAGHGGTAAH
ncbi:MAG: hypothetical protein HZA03_08945 [Nitrospinae bacterium]|nr:hypothetical protein [Nitrospinota bacterium]